MSAEQSTMKADLHAHTHFSRDGVTSVETFARRYQRAAIDCVAVSESVKSSSLFACSSRC